MKITALVIGGSFVSEQGPDRRITVEVKDEVRPQPLKKWSLRFVVELSDNVLIKLVGNAWMRKHRPVDGDELSDEFRR